MIRRLIRAWLSLAITDLLWAIVLSLAYGRAAMAAFVGVANVALARSWFPDVAPSATLGVVLHFTVALTWASIYIGLQTRVEWLDRLSATTRGRVAIAAVYGPLIWVVMSGLVIPFMTGNSLVLSARWAIQLTGHVFFVGIPVVLGAGPRRERAA